MDFNVILTPKIEPKSDAEQSLFCDAMGIARTPAEVSQGRSFWIIYLVTHMIRSGI